MKPAKKLSPPSLPASPFAAAEVVDGDNLGMEDRKFLLEREKTIETGRATFLEVGKALIEIRDYKDELLYKRYGGWEQYCKERWDFGLSYAYRLVGAAEVAAQLSPRGESLDGRAPTSEKQLRDLYRLAKPEDMRKAWKEASQEAGEREVTAGLVSKAVRNLIKADAKPRTAARISTKMKPTRVQMEIKHLGTIRVQLDVIRSAAAGTKAAGKIEDATRKIEALLPE